MKHGITGPRGTARRGSHDEHVGAFPEIGPRRRHARAQVMWAKVGAWVALFAWFGVLSMFTEGIIW